MKGQNVDVEYDDSLSLLKIFLLYLLACGIVLAIGVLCANNPALGSAVVIAAILIGAKTIDHSIRKKSKSPTN